jgi:succinate-semialdehyde dehydrogenase/glutarate-semialdehyde dehydrogenase
MELGGNAPFVVFDDADIPAAVAGLMIAKMRNGGAACTAANRVYVQKSVAEQFTKEFSQAMSQLKMGKGTDAGIQLGASVSIKERNKIAVKAGGKLHTGGTTPDGDGAFYPATVISVDKNNDILNHEVFGPVAPIVTFDTDAEAIQLANSTDFGLISYVFTKDLARAIRTAEAIESGMVAINKGVISDPAAPFGGVKQSGLGREGGFDGIHEFLETKYIGVEI